MNDFDLVRQLLGVLTVFAILGTLVYFLGRRHTGGALPFTRLRRGSGRMEVLDRLYLTPQHSLHVVRVGSRGLLISVHPAGCSLIETVTIDDFQLRAGAP